MGLKRPSSTSWLKAASMTAGTWPSAPAAVVAVEIGDVLHRPIRLFRDRLDVRRNFGAPHPQLILRVVEQALASVALVFGFQFRLLCSKSSPPAG